jgi:hypothetical protein
VGILLCESVGILFFTLTDVVTYECLNRPYRVKKIGDDDEDDVGDDDDQKKRPKKKVLKKKRDDESNINFLNLNDYVTRPVPSIRGHTGFLTFARKPMTL